MGVDIEDVCNAVYRGRLRFQRWKAHVALQFKFLRDPDTTRQAKITAALQIGLTVAGCAVFATFGILAFYMQPPDTKPPAPTNPRPAIVWATSPYGVVNRSINCLHEGRFLECDIYDYQQVPPGGADAYVFYGTTANNYPIPRSPSTLWILMHEESPRNNGFLLHDKGLRLFNFTATFSQFSDVPFPLIYMAGGLATITELRYYKNVSTKNSLLHKLAPVVYIQSDCSTSTERDEYVMELMKYINIDSYGLCLHNRDLPLRPELSWENQREYLRHLQSPEVLEFLSYYKFWINIENGPCKDYMTEKLWRPLRVGVVPIYLGAPNVRDYLPHPKAAILLEDYPTTALMAARLHELNSNDQLYEEYLRHKLSRRVDNQRLHDESELRPYQFTFLDSLGRLECMACVRLHENSSRVSMGHQKHYDCGVPISALTLDVNPDNEWIASSRRSEEDIDMVYEELAKGANVTEHLVHLRFT